MFILPPMHAVKITVRCASSQLQWNSAIQFESLNCEHLTIDSRSDKGEDREKESYLESTITISRKQKRTAGNMAMHVRNCSKMCKQLQWSAKKGSTILTKVNCSRILICKVSIAGQTPNAWPSSRNVKQPMKLQSSVNLEVRTSTLITQVML